MREIQMVDLQYQYFQLKDEIDAAMNKVISTSAFINGPEVKSFQQDLANYMNSKHCIACANGTDALQIALMALGIQPGDEVITSNFTFIATIEVIALLGAIPVLVDVCPKSYNLRAEDVEKVITPKTKAIIPVHLFGQCANVEALMQIAEKHHLFVIEDCAQALGSDFYFTDGTTKKAGTIGHIGCTSFFPSKNLGCYGDGGAIFTQDDALAEKLRMITNHGSKVKYYHDCLGVNSRLDTLQAAVLKVKLPHLDEYNLARTKAADYYDKALANIDGLQLPYRNSKRSSHIFHQYTMVVEKRDRNELKDFLQSKGIPSMVYYPMPFHLQKAFAYLPYKKGDFPVTEFLCEHVLSLPMHPHLEEEQLLYITAAVKEFFKK
jgi:UDP-2-acetamido-2-deoxy-ribo-hexuluronate aminotransferase